jgi:hypothetical protein
LKIIFETPNISNFGFKISTIVAVISTNIQYRKYNRETYMFEKLLQVGCIKKHLIRT